MISIVIIFFVLNRNTDKKQYQKIDSFKHINNNFISNRKREQPDKKIIINNLIIKNNCDNLYYKNNLNNSQRIQILKNSYTRDDANTNLTPNALSHAQYKPFLQRNKL